MTSRSDKVIIGILVFFIVIAWTVELYWMLNHRQLAALASHQFLARLLSYYAPADRMYFAEVTPLALTLEGINVYFTQAVHVWLIYAILRQRPYRHVLQLAVGSYVAYSVILYYVHMQVGGFAQMERRTPAIYALFYGANLPWLLGPLYFVLDSARAITRCFSAQRVAPA
jgi:hypothetical protein